MTISETILIPLFSIWAKGVLWLSIVCVLAFVLRALKASAGSQRMLWISNLIALLVLAGLQIAGPRWRIAAPEFAAKLPPSSKTGGDALPVTLSSGKISPATDSRPLVVPESITAWSVIDSVFVIWLVGSGLIGMRLVRNQRRLRRLWRQAESVDQPWCTALDLTRKQLRLEKIQIEMRQSNSISSPMVWGTLRVCILLPGDIEASRRLILLHELQHVRSRDHLINLLSQLNLLIHWPNPLAWFTANCLRQSQERACDDHVLAHLQNSTDAANYADLLVSLARRPHVERLVALSMTSPPSALRKRVTSILDTTMTRTQPGKREQLLTIAPQVIAAATLAALTFGESASAQEKRDNDALRQRVAELESEVDQLKSDSAAAIDAAKLEKIREENKNKARQRMREDRDEYDNEELREIETLYQVANKNWRSDEARSSLETLVKKYQRANRTGCAVLYLGQMSSGDQREKYLRKAIEDFSDCYYGNGCQVGGYARYLLAAFLKEKGDVDGAETIVAEIRKEYDTATGHNGKLIVSYLESLE